MAETSTTHLRNLLSRTVGPSPWYWETFPSLSAGSGQRFVWTHQGNQGALGYLVSLCPEQEADKPRLALNTYCRPFLVPPSYLGVWCPEGRSLRVMCFDPAQLKPFDFAEVAGWFKQSSERIYAATAPIAEFEIPLALAPGTHKIEVPPELQDVEEVIAPTSYPSKGTDDPAFALYVIYPSGGLVEVLPQRWFTAAQYEVGRQWIPRVARDPESQRMVGECFGVGSFLLEEDGQRLDRWIEKKRSLVPHAPGQLRRPAPLIYGKSSELQNMAERVDPSLSAKSPAIESRVDPTSARFEANMRFLADLVSQVRNEEEKIREGGGAKAIESQHAKGRLTARERIHRLADPGSFFELSEYAAHGMYDEWGGAPAAGVITGLARIHTRLVMVIANDATVKAGAFFPMTAKKVIRAQNIAIENRVPTIYLVDSSGVFLPLQEDVFPDTDDFGRVFRNNAVMSALGIPQIAAIMGMCVAGGGYLPVMCDHVLMTDGSGLFLAGPALVQAAIGQKTSAEDLGGAAMHAAISGTVDFREPNDESCLERIRSMVEKWGYRRQSPWDRRKPEAPAFAAEEIYGIYDSSATRPYDMKEVLARLLDGSRFDEYKPEYGKTIICGYARIGGFAVGIVANQKLHAQQIDHEGHKRMEFGGVIYTESAEKAARFIMDCNQNLVPLVFLHDVNGFMVGKDAEWSGIIKAGAKMVNAVSNSVVPKITVIVGGSFGAGHYAMCGKAYDPRFVFAWPTARYAVMSGDAAASTLVEIKIRQLERGGKKLSEEEKKELYESVKRTYDEQTDPRYGAARLWIDKIIDPIETRDAITQALEAATLNPDVPEFKVGVLQT